jgi:hypothetical protein
MISETLTLSSALTQLITQEDFSTSVCYESCKGFINISKLFNTNCLKVM